MRFTMATLISPILFLTGFRFSKAYRNGATVYHRAIYAMISTVSANIAADNLCIRGGK
jgi:hypothetical protein